jgi:hypothetical protein
MGLFSNRSSGTSSILTLDSSNNNNNNSSVGVKNNPTFFSTSTIVYITKYISIPGPKGKDGVDGKNGVDGINGKDANSSQASYIPIFTGNVVSNSSSASSLSNVTISGGTFSSGFGNNLVLSSSTFNGSSIFNGGAFFSGGIITDSLTASSSVFVNATTTNTFVVTGTSTLATTTVSNLSLSGSFIDSKESAGSPGQVLASNGTSTYWTYVTDVSGVLLGGSATSSTVYWNGSTWMENLNFFADISGNITANGGATIFGTTSLATTTISSLSVSGTSNFATTTISDADIDNLYAATATISNLNLLGELRDSNGVTGLSGQVLATNGT